MPKHSTSKLNTRNSLISLIASILLVLFSFSSSHADEALKLMAWNVEHLNEANNTGCVPREDGDYQIISEHLNKIDPDVVAFQEVETATAAARIFNPAQWNIVFSSRPNTGQLRECWQEEGKYLRHLGTGFAIKKGIEYARNPDFKALGLEDQFQRWGTDITLKSGSGAKLRLLSIHLRSGCWGPPQDAQPANACPQLHQQSKLLADWVEARSNEDIPFAILGDFNRRLALENDWMWNDLNESLPSVLLLLDQGVGAKCDPRYKDFIDHIVLDHRAFKMYQQDSFREIPRDGEHPDHCAITALMRL